MEEIVKVVSIDATQAVSTLDDLNTATKESSESFKTLGEAKQYIDRLKGSLDNLDKSSAEYSNQLKEIDNAQNRLAKAVDNTGKVANRAYGELTSQLKNLQQKFKSANSEAERMALASQIDVVETKLKEMNTTVSSLQSSMTAYSTEFVSGLDNIAAGLDVAIPGLEQYYRYFKDVILAGRSLGSIFSGLKTGFTDQNTVLDNSTKSIRNMAGATTALEGAQTFAAGATTTFTKATAAEIATLKAAQPVWVQTAKAKLALMDAEEAFKDALGKGDGEEIVRAKKALDIAKEKLKTAELEAKANQKVAESTDKAAKSVNLLSKAWAKFKKLLSPTGLAIAAVAAAIAVLVTKIKKLKEDLDIIIELNKTTAGAAEQIVTLSLLSRKYKELGDNVEDKKQFLTDYADAIGNTGIEIKDLNDAEDVFINNTDKYIESLKKKAKAQGAYNLLVKEMENYLEEKTELEAKTAVSGAFIPLFPGLFGNVLTISKYRNKRKLANLEANHNKKTDFLSNLATLDSSDSSSSSASSTSSASTSSALPDLLSLFQEESEQINEEIITEAKDTSKQALDIWARATLARIPSLQRELLELKTKFETEKQLLIDNGIATEALTEEYEKNRLAIIAKYREQELAEKEAYLNQQQQLNNQLISYRTDNEYLQRQLALNSEKEHLEQLKAIYESRLVLYEKDSTEYKAVAELIEETNSKLGINLKSQAKLQEDIAQHVKETWRSNIEIITGSISSIASAWQAVLDAEKDKLSEEGNLTQKEVDNYNKKREALKAFQIASIIISAAAASFDIWRGYNLERVVNAETAAASGPAAVATLASLNTASLVKAIANQATTLANATASIASIKSETLQASTASTSSVSPTAVATQYSPNYSTNITGQTETTNLANALSDIKVYVTEYDLQQAAKRVQVRQGESTF